MSRAEQCARKSDVNSEHGSGSNRRWTLNQLKRHVKMSEWWSGEDEEPLEARVPRARLNPKNPTCREKQEHEDSGHVVCRSDVCCVDGRGVGGQHRIVMLDAEERERATPIFCAIH